MLDFQHIFTYTYSLTIDKNQKLKKIMLDTIEETPRLNLRICGAKSSVVDLDAVRRVRTPKETNRWKPVPRATVVDITRNNLEESGFEIVNECHNLAKQNDHCLLYTSPSPRDQA